MCLRIKISVGENKNDALYFSRQWKLESCNEPKFWKYLPMEIHYERCCLLPGQYTLTCINKRSKYGWGNAFLEIAGKRYCDDFVGFKAMRTISILGKN